MMPKAQHLPRLIEGLRAQEFQDFETVLADPGSTDDTVDIARPYVDRLVKIDSRDFIFGYSLNRGITAAEPLPADGPVRDTDNMLLSPHNSNSSPTAWERVHESALPRLVDAQA
jgi:glycosyltransferase involved in cell wall biosynthesis